MADTTTELLQEYMTKETPIFVNDRGVGRIIEIKKDHIVFAITKEENETKKKKNGEGKMESYTETKLMREDCIIPLSQIEIISEGEKEVPKTDSEQKIDDDLGDL